MKSKKLVIVLGGLMAFVGLGVIGIGVVPKMLGHYSWSIERFYRPAPEQPVPFPHPQHVQIAGVDCVFCHRTVTTERMASIPPVEQCYFCHKVVGQQVGGAAALDGVNTLNQLSGWDATIKQFGPNPQPINWVRVHRLPDHVRFVHEAHVNFFSENDGVVPSLTCATCHGKVESMEQVKQDRSLRMGDCVSCHREWGAPTDCVTCHY